MLKAPADPSRTKPRKFRLPGAGGGW
jgi:hypothetical protein